jgi:hypothetical protein
MDFAEAWDTLAIGDEVTVSNGMPRPNNFDGIPYRMWVSHNFTGTLVEKIDGEWRAMKFELPPSLAFVIAFTVQEAIPHTFESAGG